MKNIKIIQYKEFKKEYEFDLMSEIALLEKVARETWDEQTRISVKRNLSNILNNNRLKSEKENTILYEYCFMLMGFMKDRPKTFDTILNHMQKSKCKYMGIEVLEQLASGL